MNSSCGMECKQAPEPMAAFFDKRVEGYDAHMKQSVELFDAFYDAVAAALPETDRDLHVLDLGVGTGLQLPAVFRRLPGASVHGIDISAGMLRKLEGKSRDAGWDVSIERGSFVQMDLGSECYDAVISTMALHHQLPRGKLALYRKIHRALRPHGLFVNGDCIVSRREAERIRMQFMDRMSDCPECSSGMVHVDVPLSIDEEVKLLQDAGFAEITVSFETRNAAVISACSESP